MMHRFLLFLSMLCMTTSMTCAQRVRVGAEVLIDSSLSLLQGKRVGIVCNHTSVLPNGAHLVDTLLRRGITIEALFSPEHGVRGSAQAGEPIVDTIDQRTGIPIFSLHGTVKKPTASMLSGVDILLFDIQDAGTRFYTYASTLTLVLEAAGEHRKPVIILDRPNPINGLDTEGWVLDTTLKSFFGYVPVPIRHGMTLGELALMIVGEKWIASLPQVHVVAMEGWHRSMWYDETGLPWISPSPNMKSLSTALVYPGMCFVEQTNVSEGRGTELPFEVAGAPWINGDTLARRLNQFQLAGVRFAPVTFTPHAAPAGSAPFKYQHQKCEGVRVIVDERRDFKPVLAGFALLHVVHECFGDSLALYSPGFDRFSGHRSARQALLAGESYRSLLSTADSSLEDFMKRRKPYLRYSE